MLTKTAAVIWQILSNRLLKISTSSFSHSTIRLLGRFRYWLNLLFISHDIESTPTQARVTPKKRGKWCQTHSRPHTASSSKKSPKQIAPRTGTQTSTTVWSRIYLCRTVRSHIKTPGQNYRTDSRASSAPSCFCSANPMYQQAESQSSAHPASAETATNPQRSVRACQQGLLEPAAKSWALHHLWLPVTRNHPQTHPQERLWKGQQATHPPLWQHRHTWIPRKTWHWVSGRSCATDPDSGVKLQRG